MNVSRAMRFLFWFAFRDLWRPTARRATWVNIGNVAVLTMIVLLVFGLFLGFTAVRLYRIERDPLSLVLWVGDPRFEHTRITPERLKQLRQELDDVEGYRGCFPFVEIEFDWFFDNSAHPDRLFPMRGRTIDPEDPFLDSLSPKHPKEQHGNFDEGVIVTKAMLDKLGYPPQPSKSMPSLRLQAPSGQQVIVPIVTVLDGDLPLGHQFAMSTAYYRKLLPDLDNSESSTIDTGAIPDDWPSGRDLPETIQALFRDLQLSLPRKKKARDGKMFWQIDAQQSPSPRKFHWRQYLIQIRESMEEKPQFGDADDAFLDFALSFDDPDDPKNFDAQCKDFAGAGIYVTKLDHLRSAAEVIKTIPLPVNEDIVNQLTRVHRNTRTGFILLSLLLGLCGMNAACNMAVIQALHSEMKTAEIGMLKAIGMSHRLLSWVYRIEAVIVCTCGFTLGGVVAVVLGKVMGPRFVADRPDEYALAFNCSHWLVGLTFVGLMVISVLAASLASRRARRVSPIQSLQAN